MERRIGTADNYAIEDEARAAEERSRTIAQGRTYERSPEVLGWLAALDAWRRGAMVGPVPPAPDISQGDRDIYSGERRPTDLSREDLRGADLGDQSPGLARTLMPRGPLSPAWARIGTILPGEEEPCVGEADIAGAVTTAVVRMLHLPTVAGLPVRRGPRYDHILDQLADAAQVYATTVVRLLSRADIVAALAERYSEGDE
jgi:hypothetical protein